MQTSGRIRFAAVRAASTSTGKPAVDHVTKEKTHLRGIAHLGTAWVDRKTFEEGL